MLRVGALPISVKHAKHKLLDKLRVVVQSVICLSPAHDLLIRLFVFISTYIHLFLLEHALPTLEPQKTALIPGEKKSQKSVECSIIAHEFDYV